MARSIFMFVALIMSFLGGHASANQLREMTLEEMALTSDTIVVGRVISTEHLWDGQVYSVLSVRGVVKGKAPAKIKVWTKVGISEFDFDCCTGGDEYILFLKGGDNNMYVPSDGRYSFVPLSQ